VREGDEIDVTPDKETKEAKKEKIDKEGE
jgi:hypothetical protein